ncbi:MAG: PilZ domain-containing protein [Vicinamibacterales bacterium]
MLSIASWRSAAPKEKEREPEPVERVVRREAPLPEKPAQIVATPPPMPPMPAVEGDHRGAPRQPSSAMPSITGLTLSPYGAEATLVNISATGLLAECRMPLKIGNFVKVLFEGALAPQPVAGRVVRICVASMASSGVRYNIGIAFKDPIALDLGSPSRGDSKPAPVAVADPQEPSDLVNRW